MKQQQLPKLMFHISLYKLQAKRRRMKEGEGQKMASSPQKIHVIFLMFLPPRQKNGDLFNELKSGSVNKLLRRVEMITLTRRRCNAKCCTDS